MRVRRVVAAATLLACGLAAWWSHDPEVPLPPGTEQVAVPDDFPTVLPRPAAPHVVLTQAPGQQPMASMMAYPDERAALPR